MAAYIGSKVYDDFGPLFQPPELKIFHHAVTMTTEALLNLVTTRSYHLTAPPQRQQETLAAIRALVAPLPQPFEVPYLTKTYRAYRR